MKPARRALLLVSTVASLAGTGACYSAGRDERVVEVAGELCEASDAGTTPDCAATTDAGTPGPAVDGGALVDGATALDAEAGSPLAAALPLVVSATTRSIAGTFTADFQRYGTGANGPAITYDFLLTDIDWSAKKAFFTTLVTNPVGMQVADDIAHATKITSAPGAPPGTFTFDVVVSRRRASLSFAGWKLIGIKNEYVDAAPIALTRVSTDPNAPAAAIDLVTGACSNATGEGGPLGCLDDVARGACATAAVPRGGGYYFSGPAVPDARYFRAGEPCPARP